METSVEASNGGAYDASSSSKGSWFTHGRQATCGDYCSSDVEGWRAFFQEEPLCQGRRFVDYPARRTKSYVELLLGTETTLGRLD